ncbi:MAG: NUDIX hydrolase [Muribaculaceae bacterium]|nr:NUDIX hydrolase [Muribaculaceae bacterium]
MDKWTSLGHEYLFRRPWLTVRKERFRLPNGAVNNEYYILEYPTWVNVIARTTDGRFVMVEQYRPGLDGIFTELVAGVAEAGEEPLQAAKRELLEETGYAGGKWSLSMVISANPGSLNNLSYSFVAEGVEKVSAQQLDTTEDVAVHLIDADTLKNWLVNDEIKQSLMAAPLWKYFALNGLL